MTPTWRVELYEDDEGCPVQKFIDTLDARRQAKLLALIDRLAAHGPTLPFPYSSQIEGKLRELRTQVGKEHYRLLYYGAPDRVFVLLHAVVKRTGVLPPEEVAIARRRMERSMRDRRDRRSRR